MEALYPKSITPSLRESLTPRWAEKAIEKLYSSSLEETKKILEFLEKKGKLDKVNECYKRFYTPLEKAASLGKIEKVKILIEKGKAKDQTALKGHLSPRWSALAAAARSAQEEVVIYLLSVGAKGDSHISLGGKEVPLVFWLVEAYCKNDYESCTSAEERLVLQQKQCKCLERILASINDLMSLRHDLLFLNKSPIQTALLHGRRDLMDVIWGFRFDWIDFQNKKARKKFVLKAIGKEHWEVVEWFTKHFSFNINAKGKKGVTLLHIAKAEREEGAVKQLIILGMDPKALTDHGEDYEAYAKRKLSKEAFRGLAQQLLGQGNFGIFGSLEESCKFLRNKDINLSIDKEKHTLLHLAAWWPENLYVYNIIIPVLLKKGASLSARNRDNLTPFDIATIKVGDLIYQRESCREEIIYLYKQASRLLERSLFPREKVLDSGQDSLLARESLPFEDFRVWHGSLPLTDSNERGV